MLLLAACGGPSGKADQAVSKKAAEPSLGRGGRPLRRAGLEVGRQGKLAGADDQAGAEPERVSARELNDDGGLALLGRHHARDDFDTAAPLRPWPARWRWLRRPGRRTPPPVPRRRPRPARRPASWPRRSRSPTRPTPSARKSQPGNNAPVWRAVRESGNEPGTTTAAGAEAGHPDPGLHAVSRARASPPPARPGARRATTGSFPTAARCCCWCSSRSASSTGAAAAWAATCPTPGA